MTDTTDTTEGTRFNGRRLTPTRREILAYRTAGIVLILAAVFMLRILAWLAFPGPGFRDVTIRTDAPTVAAGAVLGYAAAYCQPTGAAEVLVLRELELDDHGRNVQLPGLAYTTEQNCESKARIVGIPSFVPPGPYKLMITTELQVNPLRRVRQVWRSNTFTVIRDPNAGAWK